MPSQNQFAYLLLIYYNTFFKNHKKMMVYKKRLIDHHTWWHDRVLWRTKTCDCCDVYDNFMLDGNNNK